MRKLLIYIQIFVLFAGLACSQQAVLPVYAREQQNHTNTAIYNRRTKTKSYKLSLPGSKILKDTKVMFAPSFIYTPSFSTESTSLKGGAGYGLNCEYQGKPVDEQTGESQIFCFKIQQLDLTESDSDNPVSSFSALMGVRISKTYLDPIELYYSFGGGYQLIDFTTRETALGAAGFFGIGAELPLGDIGSILLDSSAHYLWGDDEAASYTFSVSLGLKM